ncbi:MAG: CarD family transcriptional regulator [Spirochaetales bacterium]
MNQTPNTSLTDNIPFKLHQQVVYPLQGVGKIISIEERPFKEQKVLYYVIYLEVSDMTVMVPVNKAESLGIRAIVSKEEAEKALNFISEEYEPVPTDWKLRYQMNLDLLKQGSVIDIAQVVRTLYHRSKIKELPILERKLFDSALKLLVDEISYSLGLRKEEIEHMVFSKLETEAPERVKVSHAARLGEDEETEFDESFDLEEEEEEEEEETFDY